MGKKGRKRLQTNPGILKTAHLACHAWVRAQTFDAVISCHNWPIKCLAFSGAEMNFRGRVCEPKIYFFVFCNTWTAFMLKYQWIRTINTGFRTFAFLIRLTEQSVNNHLREFTSLKKINTNELGPAWHIAGNHRIRGQKIFRSRRHFGE